MRISDWSSDVCSSDLPVIQEILKVLPATLELTLVSLVLGAVIGIPLGVWSAVKRNRLPDYVTRLASLLGLSFPAFVSAVLLLLVFAIRSEEHTSELQSLMRISYAVFCLKKKKPIMCSTTN